MKFMFMVKGGADYEAGNPPPPALLEAIGKLTQEMIKAGIFVGNGGLLPSRFGAKVRVARGKLSVVDGPFTETKEVIGGYGILEASSKAEAIKLAARFMEAHRDVLGPSYQGECEVRQMMDGDCGAAHAAMQAERAATA